MASNSIATTMSQSAAITIEELLSEINNIRDHMKTLIQDIREKKLSYESIIHDLAVVISLEDDLGNCTDESDDDDESGDGDESSDDDKSGDGDESGDDDANKINSDGAQTDKQINAIVVRIAIQDLRDDYDEKVDKFKEKHIETKNILHREPNNLQLQLTDFLNHLLLFIKTGGNRTIRHISQALPTVFEYLCYSLIETLSSNNIKWTADELKQIPSQIFQDHLGQTNRRIKHVGGGNDKGRDLLLYKDESTCYCVVQCKKSQDIKKGNGNSIVLALVGSLVLENCKHGIIMTTDEGFTKRQKTPELIHDLSGREYYINCLFYRDIQQLINLSPQKTSLLILKNFTKLFKTKTSALLGMEEIAKQFVCILNYFDEIKKLSRTLDSYDEENFGAN